ncbi:hypothetical protein J8631_05675 [Serratia fonticola]|uniref:hypothetical protein n=1 Tax=Serratia fonticola TaxID=47917 RepID=UPI001AE3B5E2|nr:hypothetical protein [Serratia fonticola]MBP1035044.1 hypothetical protein [Serratia fonticola]
MNDLEKSILALSRAHDKFRIQGEFTRGDEVKNKWPNGLACSKELEYFFNNYDPRNVKIETGFTPIKFFSMDVLEKAQYGYKWIKSSTSVSVNPSWPDDYVVFMDDVGGGKPIIAVTTHLGTSIYANYDVGVPFKIADSLSDYLFSLAKLIEIVYGEFNIFDIADDNGLNNAFVKRLKEDIEPVIGVDNFNGFLDYFYG